MPVKYLKSSVLVEIKMAVRVGTTTAITNLSGGAPSTLDGVALAVGDRVLVNNQADAKQNGIYQVTVLGTGANGTWVRASDFNENADIKAGALVVVTEGTTQADTVWELSTNDPIVLGTSNINFALVGGSSAITGSGTAPYLCYFSAGNIISSTSHAQHGVNDIIFNDGIAIRRVETGADYSVLPQDCYVGGTNRLVPIAFTMPPLSSVQNGHLFVLADQSGQSPGLPIIPTAQVGENFIYNGFSTPTLVTFLPGQTYIVQKQPTGFFVLSD